MKRDEHKTRIEMITLEPVGKDEMRDARKVAFWN
jgi:hypothetical protein